MFAVFAANILDAKNIINNLIYFFLTAFANVVLTFEILSLFSKISITGVLLLNILLLLIIFGFWLFKGRPFLAPDYKKVFKSLAKALFLDKCLLLMSAAFLFMLAASFVLVILIPSVDTASAFYHVVRPLFWIENGSLNHFIIQDARLLDFPVNSEILYAWVMLFLKKDAFLSGFSFAGFLFYCVALFGISGFVTSSLRRKLWIIFVVSSFTTVIASLSSNETNIIIAALVLSSLYLFLKGGRYGIFMSAMAYALAAGTKTSALLLLPAVFLWMIIYGVKFQKLKSVFAFAGFFAINFIFFAAYNYILNFIDYGHFTTCASLGYSHSNVHGVRGFMHNLLSYMFMPFQLNEWSFLRQFVEAVYAFKIHVMKALGITPYIGLYSNESAGIIVDAARSGLGIHGLIVFFPSLLISLITAGRFKNKKVFLINSFGWLFVTAFLIMTAALVYMSYNIRFIVTFALICAPVMYYSYCKKLGVYKLIVTLAAIGSFIFIPLNITDKNLINILSYLNRGDSIQQLRERGYCSEFLKNGADRPVSMTCSFRNYLRTLDKRNRILYFPNEGESLLFIKMLQFEGYKIDFGLIERIGEIDFSKYNIVITFENSQISNLFYKVKEIKDGKYKNNGITCRYEDVSRRQIIEYSKNIKPVRAFCSFDEYFFMDKFFSEYYKLVMTEGFIGAKDSYTYYVYENLNNPILH